jgi:hypothetical protein
LTLIDTPLAATPRLITTRRHFIAFHFHYATFDASAIITPLLMLILLPPLLIRYHYCFYSLMPLILHYIDSID